MIEKKLTLLDFEPTEDELYELYSGSVTKENYFEIYTSSESHNCAIINLLQLRGLESEAKAFAKFIQDPELKQLLFSNDLIRT